MEENLKQYIKEKYQKENSGHDYQHILKVVENTRFIAKKEQLSEQETKQSLIIAYLHEELDHKLIVNLEQEKESLKHLLGNLQISPVEVDFYIKGIEAISFSKRTAQNDVPYLVKVVQDADLLEAIGAMGIVRTITYGAVKNRILYDPNAKGVANSSTIQHFYDKLLKIPDYLSTKTGKEQGGKRMRIMIEFLAAFFEEWEGLR